ncbi:unnamed protein product [Mytilus coruscus]|uniref:Uncharacterized protein n=1 Tax=Mytilus coruscus TaxID=42192 RepID=A0A6J8CWQ2_MYTCO|nr:unnamed protein product [Mytilus coruscus]
MRLQMKGICIPFVCMILVTCIKCEHNMTKRSSWKTRDDSSKMVKVINRLVRKEMLEHIPSEMESIRATYETSSNQCSDKIKKAVEDCKQCVKKEQELQHNPCVFLLNLVMEVGKWLYKSLIEPYVEAGKLVIDIAGKLKDTLGDLGKDSVQFLNDLGKFSEKLGNDLLKGGGEVIQNSVVALKNVGEDLVRLGDDVAKGVGKGVEDITKGIGNSLDNLRKETGNLIHGIDDVTKDIGKGVQHVATQVFKPVHNVMSSVSRTVGGWFGKRDLNRMRRICSMNCNICDKLDDKKHSKKQIVTNICGTEMNALKERIDKVNKNLKALFDILHASSLPNGLSIIKSVRYDRDSEDDDEAYTENYVTYEMNGKRKEIKSTSVFDRWDLIKYGKSIGNQIMSIIRKQDFAIV